MSGKTKLTDEEKVALEDMARRSVKFAGKDPDETKDGKPLWSFMAWVLWQKYGSRIVELSNKQKRFAELIRKASGEQ